MKNLSKLIPVATLCCATACAHTGNQEVKSSGNADYSAHLQRLNATEEGVQPDGSVVACESDLPASMGRMSVQLHATTQLIAAINGTKTTVQKSGNMTSTTTTSSGSISGVTTEFSAPSPEGDSKTLCAKVTPPTKKDIDALIAYYRKTHASQQVISQVQQNFGKTQNYQQEAIKKMLNRKRIKNMIRRRQGN